MSAHRCGDCGEAMDHGEGRIFTVCSKCWFANNAQGEAQREAGNQSSRKRSPSTRAAAPSVLADHGGSESATTQGEGPDCQHEIAELRAELNRLRALSNVQAENLRRDAGWVPHSVRFGMTSMAEWVQRGEKFVEAMQARAEAAEHERDELREALGKLANEAAGFLYMAYPEAHGITNMRVLEGRITEALALLTPKEPTK